MKAWKNILLASMYTLALGCSGNNSSGLDDFSSTAPDSGSSDSSVPSGSPLYLIVKSTLDGTEDAVVRTSNCHIPEGTAIGNPGTGLPAAAYGTCSVSVPELTLFHSKLDFTVGTNSASVCEKVIFYPFFYTRSLASVPQTNSSTPLDCSNFPAPATCYGGAAPEIVPGFPLNIGAFHLPAENLKANYELKSIDKRRATDFAFSLVTTNADVANAGFSAIGGDLPDVSVPGSDDIIYDFSLAKNPDYVVACEDKWGTAIYTLTLTITDEDSTSGGFVFDHIWDWNAP